MELILFTIKRQLLNKNLFITLWFLSHLFIMYVTCLKETLNLNNQPSLTLNINNNNSKKLNLVLNDLIHNSLNQSLNQYNNKLIFNLNNYTINNKSSTIEEHLNTDLYLSKHQHLNQGEKVDLNEYSNKEENRNLFKKNNNINEEENDKNEEEEDENEKELKNLVQNSNYSIKNNLNREQQSLINLQKFILDSVEKLIKNSLPLIVSSSYETNVSTFCSSSFLNLVHGLQANKQWAFKMIDSSGKLPSGILDGTLTDFGSFEECLSINNLNKDTDNTLTFTGKYCIMDIKPDFDQNIQLGSKPPNGIRNDSLLWHSALQLFWSRNNLLSFRYGLCIPSVCTEEDLNHLTEYFFDTTGMVAEINFCQSDSDQEIDTLQIFIIICISSIFLFVIIGSLLEISLRKLDKLQLISTNKKCLIDFLLCFSFIKNSKIVFISNENKEKKNKLKHLNGVRFLSTCWIIIGHTYFYTDFVHYHHFRNLAKFKYLDDNFWFMPIANFTLSVETYFFISGLLVVYSNWHKLVRAKGKLNIIDFMLHRVWRILPSYLVTIAIILILPLFGSGPLWPQAVLNSANICRENWWYNVLFINNFQNPDNVCMFHTWFLSVNIQFYLITLPLLYILYKYPKIFFTILLIGICLCAASVFYYTQVNNLLIPALIADDIFVDFEKKILILYVMPYYHLPSYLIGMIFGYYMIKNKNILVTYRTRCILWILSFSGLLIVIFLPYQSFQGKPTSLKFSSSYLSLHRIVWSLSFGWLVLALSNGYGKLINNFLSYEFFRPLSLLSYLTYLIHPVLMIYHTGIVRERVNLTHYQFLNTFLSRVILSFTSAYILYVIVEMPFANIEKYLFPYRFKDKEKKNISTIDYSNNNQIISQNELLNRFSNLNTKLSNNFNNISKNNRVVNRNYNVIKILHPQFFYN